MLLYRFYKCKGFKIQNKSAAQNQIVFLGDSLTDWCNLYEFYKSPTNKILYNRGIAGDTTFGLLKRLKCSVFDLNPAQVILLIGTNDIRYKVRKAKTLINYESIIELIKEVLPHTKITVLGVPPQGPKAANHVQSLNKAIEDICQKNKITFVNTFKLLATEQGILENKYSADGLHLTSHAYNQFAKHLTLE